MQTIALKPGFSDARLVVPNPFEGVSPDPVPEGIKASVQARDLQVCSACGFASDRFMEVVPRVTPAIVPQDYATLCRACWLIENLDVAAMNAAGDPIWAPELDQLEINRAMPYLYVQRVSPQGHGRKAIDRVLDIFKERRTEALTRLGGKKGDTFVEVLSKGSTSARPSDALLDEWDSGFRLWPLDRWIQRAGQHEFNAYPSMIAHWRRRFANETPGDFGVAAIAQDWLTRLSKTEDNRA